MQKAECRRQNEMRRCIIVSAFILLSGCVTVQHQKIPSLKDLSLDEKIGQLFAGAGHGNYTNESGWRYRDLLHQVQDNKVGGLIWFVSNVYETAFLTQQLQKAAHVPLLISADLEAGIGMRFLDTTFW